MNGGSPVATAGAGAMSAGAALDSPPLLECEHVSRRFGDRLVIDDVSLQVSAGRCLALVGPSGSGKSTLARIAVGLLSVTAGKVRLAGQPVDPRQRERRGLAQRAQIIFQDPIASLDPQMRVAEAVCEPLVIHRVGPIPKFGRAHREWQRQRACELLAAVGLADDVVERRPSQLSVGQCQRVTIARALALRPSLIVADEPLASLDTVNAARALELMERLKRDFGIAFLFISHALDAIRRLADRIAVIDGGHIVENAPTDELFENPLSACTRRLLAARRGFMPAAPAVG